MRGEKHSVEVRADDTVTTLKSVAQKKLGISFEKQSLLYGGKKLENILRLSTYNISDGATINCVAISAKQKEKSLLHSRSPQDAGPSSVTQSSTSSFFPGKLSTRHYGGATASLDVVYPRNGGSLVEVPFLSIEETVERMNHCIHRAHRQGLKPSVHIIDPLCYYSHLDYLERSVVLESEFFRCRGIYELDESQIFEDSRDRENLQIIPAAMWQRLPKDLILTGGITAESQEARQILSSLWGSYMIICHLLTSFDRLQAAEFSTTFYTMLVKHPGKDMAELVRIEIERILGLKAGIETAIAQIFEINSNRNSEIIHVIEMELSDCIAIPSSHLLGTMLLPNDIEPGHLSILTACRMTALLLDLSLVSYVGSHGSHFNAYIGSRTETFEINNKNGFNGSQNSFTCSLMPLACLDGFLDHARVWVFGSAKDRPSDRFIADDSVGLSILTQIEEFADIWGPVYAIPIEGSPNLVRQYNLSKGAIRRIRNTNGEIEYAAECHWDSELYDNDSIPITKGMSLLIGASFRVNNQCAYQLEDFDRDCLSSMPFLGTAPPSWALDSRSGGISFGQYVNASVSGTQKRLPGTTLKQSIWNEFSHNPEGARVEWLHNFLGVEVSHCTGNARRIKLKEVFLLSRMQKRLQGCYPGWEQTPWGRLLLPSLRSDNQDIICDVWVQNPSMRKDIANFICQVLGLLHNTGDRGPAFLAAHFNDNVDRCFEIKANSNEWAKSLQDTHLKATYAITTGICLKCQSRRSNIITSCDYNQPAKTAFQTRIEFQYNITRPTRYIRLDYLGHGGQLFQTVETRGNQLTLIPVNGIINWHPQISTASEIMVRTTFENSPKQFNAIIRASSLSYGGLDYQQRQQQQQQQQIPQLQLQANRRSRQHPPTPVPRAQPVRTHRRPGQRSEQNQPHSSCCFA